MSYASHDTSGRAVSARGAAADELVDTVLAASRALVAVAARSLAAAAAEVTLYPAAAAAPAGGGERTGDRCRAGDPAWPDHAQAA